MKGYGYFIMNMEMGAHFILYIKIKFDPVVPDDKNIYQTVHMCNFFPYLFLLIVDTTCCRYSERN